MKGLIYRGPDQVAVAEVAEPKLHDEHGAIVRVTTAGICGSDLHIYQGHGFSADTGYCMGHEAVGTVLALGAAVSGPTVGSRVLVPATVSCSSCSSCRAGLVSRCRDAGRWGAAACYGLSRALPGSQAELVAVPHAEHNLMTIPDSLSDDDAVVLTDNAPTAWHGARRARVSPGDTVAVIGLGPVGLMTVQAAFAMGAAHVFGIDVVPDRLARAASVGAEPIAAEGARQTVLAATDGGTDAAIEAVGADETITLALRLVRTGGRVSVVGVTQNKAYPMHLQAAQARELEITLGICSVQYELPSLLKLTAAGRLRPSTVVSHRLPLSDGAKAYRLLAEKADGTSKIVLDPTR